MVDLTFLSEETSHSIYISNFSSIPLFEWASNTCLCENIAQHGQLHHYLISLRISLIEQQNQTTLVYKIRIVKFLVIKLHESNINKADSSFITTVKKKIKKSNLLILLLLSLKLLLCEDLLLCFGLQIQRKKKQILDSLNLNNGRNNSESSVPLFSNREMNDVVDS